MYVYIFIHIYIYIYIYICVYISRFAMCSYHDVTHIHGYTHSNAYNHMCVFGDIWVAECCGVLRCVPFDLPCVPATVLHTFTKVLHSNAHKFSDTFEDTTCFKFVHVNCFLVKICMLKFFLFRHQTHLRTQIYMSNEYVNISALLCKQVCVLRYIWQHKHVFQIYLCEHSCSLDL